MAHWVKNMTNNHEDAGLIPDLTQWAKQRSGIAISCGVGCRCDSDPVLLWLWRRPAATALIQPLAPELPYAKFPYPKTNRCGHKTNKNYASGKWHTITSHNFRVSLKESEGQNLDTQMTSPTLHPCRRSLVSSRGLVQAWILTLIIYPQTVWLSVKHLKSQNLSFLICKGGMIIAPLL